MTTHAKPEVFDVSTLEDQIAEIAAQPDYAGKGTRVSGSLRRLVDSRDRGSVESRLGNDPEVGEQGETEMASEVSPTQDAVNHPRHYNAHPSGVECITVTRWMNFNLGNVVKYVWRSGEKGATIEDLKKARWYLDDEIGRLEGLSK